MASRNAVLLSVNRLRILLISAESTPEDPLPSRVSYLARSLAAGGHKVYLISNAMRSATIIRNLIPKSMVKGGIVWIFAPTIRLHRCGRTFEALLNLCNLGPSLLFSILVACLGFVKADLIYASTAQSQGLIGCVVSAIRRLVLVVDYGDPSFARDKGLARRISSFVETISVNRADALISSDPLISAFIVRRWNRQARFLPNGYDERLFAPVAPKSPSAHKTITFVGKIDTSVYRLDILLKAFRLVIDELPSARLRLIGSGPDTEKLRRLALKLKLEGAVNFIGLVAHSDVPTWIRQSDVCVHMTNDTCMGLKVVEYMASAKPVVMAAPWWDKYDSFVENERNCLTVPPQPRALSAAILRILRNPMLAARLGRNARRTVQQYSWHNIAAALVQLTEGL